MKNRKSVRTKRGDHASGKVKSGGLAEKYVLKS